MRYIAGLLLLLGIPLMGQGSCGGTDTDADGDDWTVEQGDCDDKNASVYPDAPELCDGVDNDCDGQVDGQDEDGASCNSCGLDQSQLDWDYYISFNGDYFGQSFTAGQTGYLTSLDVQIMTTGAGQLTIYDGGIVNAAPAGSPITSQSVTFTAGANEADLENFVLETPVYVEAGKVYTWRIQSSSWIDGYGCANCYSGGISLAYDGYDHLFQTYMACE